MSKQDLPQFTGLRGIAAGLVLFFHIRTPDGLTLTFGQLDAFSRYGSFGVDVFFVLSGFILSHVYGARFGAPNGAGLRDYARARFGRVYPLHVVTLFMMLGAYAVATHVGRVPTEASGYSWQGVILGLLLVHEWFGLVAPNPGSWSISIEFASYLLFPLFIGPLLRLPRAWPFVIIAAGTLLVEIFDGARVLRSVVEFVMGCAAFSAARHVDARPAAWLSGVLFVLPFLLSAAAGHELAGVAALCFAGAIFLLAAGASRDPFRALCSSRPIVFLGEISYSVYLLQWFIWIGFKHVIARLSPFVDHPYLLALCAAVAVIACAIPSYYLIERPARRWIRQSPVPAAGTSSASGVPRRA